MPTEENVTRKLRAILSADVKGYSLLMFDDEEFTIKTLNSYRKVMSSQIVRHKGRVVDSVGDNLLAEFSSVVDAVRCSVEIQKDLQQNNADLPSDKRLEFRIGVNIGDVIQEGDRIYGNGVNVAARIEGLAESGGICISRNAYSHVRDKLELGYKYLGEHSVKNIKRPVRVYKVLMNPEDAGKLTGQKPQRHQKKWPALAIATVAILIGIIVWQFYYEKSPPIEAASVDNMLFSLPEKPSIAVLPFRNISGSSRQDYIADGITDSITGTISRVSGLFVISSESSSAFKNKDMKIGAISEQLGVQNILKGTVQKVDDRLRINVQLIDALTGQHLWSEKYDHDMGDIFSVQDNISKKILTALQVKLVESEQARVWARGTDNLDAYIKYLQAYEHFRSFTKENMVLTRKGMQEAIELDPNYDAPYVVFGTTHLIDVWFNWGESISTSMKKAQTYLNKAIELAPNADLPYAGMGHLYLLQRDFDKAVEIGEKAIRLNPNSDLNYFLLGCTFNYVRRYEEALTLFKKAQRRNPNGPAWYIHNAAYSYLHLGRFDESIAESKRSLQIDPDHFPALNPLASAYGWSGRIDEGRAVVSQILKINPNAHIATGPGFYKYEADAEKVRDGLRKVGYPEKKAPEEPEKPSIAVLPFDNLSDDPEQEYFSDGIAVEIINGLVRWPPITIIPKSSSFIYKGKTVDVKQVGREMGVRYVLEGSIRRDGNRVRVAVQLIDVTTLKHVFSERYDRELTDIFAIQDEITMRVLTAMRISLTGTGVPSKRSTPTKSIEAYLKLLQAEDIFISMNRDTQAQAKRLAGDAIALDPDYARAYALLAATIGNEVLLGVYENPEKALDRSIELNEKAIQLDDSENMAHRVRGFLALQKKDYEKAITEAERAIELAPNSVMAQIILGYFLYSAGRTEEAIPILENAVALNPIPFPRALSHLGIAYRKARRYEEAVEICRKLIQIKPNYIYPHLTLAATYAEINNIEEAREEIKEVLRINPKYTVKLVPRSFPWKEQAELDRLADSLRKAGLPD